MKHDDGFKRLEGHQQMKEIPASFGPEEIMATAAAPVGRKPARKGFGLGTILGAVCAIALAGALFCLSYYHFFGDNSGKTAVNTGATTAGIKSDKAMAAAGQTAQGGQAVTLVRIMEVRSGNLAQNKAPTTATTAAAADAASATASAAASAATVRVRDTLGGTLGDITVTAKKPVNEEGNIVSPAELLATTAPDVICLYPTDGSAIPESKKLNDLAQEAVAEDADVLVTGYTDESGSAAYNQQLSARRADAVADYLVAHGVPRSHIVTEGLGETHAFPTPALDRRVEVRLVI